MQTNWELCESAPRLLLKKRKSNSKLQGIYPEKTQSHSAGKTTLPKKYSA